MRTFVSRWLGKSERFWDRVLGARTPERDRAKARFAFTQLEDRVVPDGRPLPFPVIAAAPAVGSTEVKLFDAETGKTLHQFHAYPGEKFAGGVQLAVADITHDNYPDIITAPGVGGGPLVKVFDGKTGKQIDGPLGSFFAYDPSFRGGVNIAAGDVNGDGWPDIVTGAGDGGGPHVKIFDGKTGVEIGGFFAFEQEFRGGVRIAVGNFNGLKQALVLGAGVGGGPRVRILNSTSFQPIYGKLGDFFAFDPSDRSGIFVATGDVTGDGRVDVVVGTGRGNSPQVRVFDGWSGGIVRDFSPFTSKDMGGVHVATAFIDDDKFADVVVGAGAGAKPSIQTYSGKTQQILSGPVGDFFPAIGSGKSGVMIAAGNDPGVNPAGLYDFLVHDDSTGIPFGVERFQKAKYSILVSGSSELEPSPTGTVTFYGQFHTGSESTDLIPIATATLVPVSPGVSKAVTDIVPQQYHNKMIHPYAEYHGDDYYRAGDLYGGDTSLIADPPTAIICDCTGISGEQENSFAPSPATAGGIHASKGTITRSIPGTVSGGFGKEENVSIGWMSDDYQGMSIFPRLAKRFGAFTAFDSAGSVLKFDQVFEDYLPRASETAIFGLGGVGYQLQRDDGTLVEFYGFASSLSIGKRGTFSRIVDPYGNETVVTDWNSNGRPTTIERTSTENGQTITEELIYTYDSAGNIIENVEIRRKVGSGSWNTVQSAEYSFGSSMYAPDLATIKDDADNVLGTTYSRFYGDGLLKYRFGPEAYDRLVDEYGTNVSSLTDEEVAPYADTYVEYETYGVEQKVSKIVAAGAGCSLCTAGQGEYTYEYTYRQTPFAGRNEWLWKTTETLPDGNQNIYYLNAFGGLLLKSYEEIATSKQWNTYYRYDDQGRVILEAGPATVTGYDEKYADLVHYVNGNAEFLSDTAGKIVVKSFYSSTTANSTTAGSVAGYPQSDSIRKGETGTAIPQQAWTYFYVPQTTSFTVPVATHTIYRNDDETGDQTTSISYTWFSGTTQPYSITTTLPTVTSAQNGPNSATSTTTVFDSFGRAIWSKDQAGFLTYTAYDTATGAVTKTISDVDTSQTSTFANLPSGWSTPSGGGLHLTTTYEIDHLGRTTKTTSPNGRVDYTVYNDPNHEVRYYPAWNSSTNTPTGPITVSRDDRARGYSETLTMSTTPSVSSGRPTGTESIANLESLSRSYRNTAGQNVYSDAYFNLSGLTYSTSTSLGTQNTHFYRTYQDYNKQGRPNRSVSAAGTITRTEYDGLNRAISIWVGTDDTPTTGFWSTTNLTGTDMVKIREFEYDNGGAGDGNLTKVTDIPGGSASNRVTQTFYDWRNRPVAVKAGVETSESSDVNRPIVYTDYDNLGQVTKTRMYDGDGVSITDSNSDGVPDAPSSSLLRAQSTSSYDELGRVYRSEVYSVDPSSGSVGSNTLKSDTWYDARGQVIKTSSPGGVVQKSQYDGLGRVTKSFVTDGGGDSGYSDADDVTGDIVLEQSESTYDSNSNVLFSVARQRFHDASGTGELGSPSSGIGARVSYMGQYYDSADRPTASVNVGTNGGSAWTRPSTVPSRSDTVFVTSMTYDSAGRRYEVTDPKGLVSRTNYDALGRTTKTIENYVDGTVGDDNDKTTEYTYGPAGMTSLTAKLTGGGGQTTEWVYGVTTSTGSGINSNDIVAKTWWPDPSSGSASSSQQDLVTVNALGQTLTSSDRNGNVHTLSYDILGRLTDDAITTLGTNVDGAVRRLHTDYDGQGNASLLTSYDAASGGSIVNQVKREYNGLGQLTSDWQSHSGAVTGLSPRVQYAYSEMSGGANHSRLTSMTYPNGYVLTSNYSSGLNSNVSRLSSLSDSGGTLESYDYLGYGTVVKRGHSQPGVDLTYIGTGTGSAGDQYVGLDAFGRVIDHNWKTSSSSTDRFTYTYDRNGNRLTKGNSVNSSFDESYSYDNLNQISSFSRGSRSQSWDYDALGNWDSVTTDSTTQTRSHNKQNEITSVSGASSPTFDSNGNMLTDETGKQFVFDAWNRLKIVKDSSGNTLKTYAYDALTHRISETAGSNTTDLYYSAGWQVLEERINGSGKYRYVWSPVYVDAMILRDRLDASERLWLQQDANFNVTALVDNSGSVVERYVYDPFGKATVLDASWGTQSGSSYAWVYLHQGGRLDATSGLYHFRNRDYSPMLGRWVSMDPIGFGGHDVNLYRFVGGRPTTLRDPYGLMGEGEINKIGDPDEVFDEIERKAKGSIPDPNKFVYMEMKAFLASVGAKYTGGSNAPKGELEKRYLFTCRCGLIDFKHFFQMMFLGMSGGSEFAVNRGIDYEQNNDQNSDGSGSGAGGGSSYLMPEDLTSNALGAYLGSLIRGNKNFPLMQMRPDQFMKELKSLVNKCGPVSWSKIPAAEQKAILDYYVFDRHKGANRRMDIGMPPGSLTDKLVKCGTCNKGDVDKGFPFAIGDAKWPNTMITGEK